MLPSRLWEGSGEGRVKARFHDCPTPGPSPERERSK